MVNETSEIMSKIDSEIELKALSELHDWRVIYCAHCGHNFPIPIPCKDRFCPVCSKIRLSKVRRKLRTLVNKQIGSRPKSVRFLTLTVISDTDLRYMIRSIKHSFRKLRQTESWKKRVTGGAYVIEITRSDYGWHAHIHAIICGDYFPFSILRDLWSSVSNGQGVYLKMIPDKAIVGYLTKYITKPDEKLTTDDRDDINEALRGSRMYQAFGQWHGWNHDIKLERPPCRECGSTLGYLIDWQIRNLEEAFNDAHEWNARGSPDRQGYQQTFLDSYVDPF